MHYNNTLPNFISSQLQGGPCFMTSIAESTSGAEQRLSHRSSARGYYFLKDVQLSYSQFEIFNSFFRNMRGKAKSFRMKDYCDYKITKQSFIAGYPNKLQLYKKYGLEPDIYLRRITHPIFSTFQITVDKKEYKYNIDFIFEEFGVIKFKSDLTASSVVEISGEFDVHARFDIDNLIAIPEIDGSIKIKELFIKEIIC